MNRRKREKSSKMIKTYERMRRCHPYKIDNYTTTTVRTYQSGLLTEVLIVGRENDSASKLERI
jgi:hypothetical protein